MKGLTLWERLRVPDYTDRAEVVYGTIAFDLDRCNRCFLCRAACPAGAILRREDGPAFVAGESECIFCGNCAAVCPEAAISLVRPYAYTGCFKTLDRSPPSLPRL